MSFIYIDGITIIFVPFFVMNFLLTKGNNTNATNVIK